MAADRIKLNPIYPTAPYVEDEGPPEEDAGSIADRKYLDYTEEKEPERFEGHWEMTKEGLKFVKDLGWIKEAK